MKRLISAHIEEWRYKAPVRITGRTFDHLSILVVEIAEAGHIGRGEATGVFFTGETASSCLDEVLTLSAEITNGLDRDALAQTLSSGGARNALDCALWDLQCKLEKRSVWSSTGIQPRPLMTLQTIGLEPNPSDVADKALLLREAHMLKLKLDQDRPVQRVEAVRKARPDVRIIVDINQGFDIALLREVIPGFVRCGVELIEQPLPISDDAALASLRSPIPICADESCRDRCDLDNIKARYQFINIKLDKTGGLTEALALAQEARRLGLGLMVGNMSGTSLASAPAYVVAHLCDIVDLDGPYSLVTDRLERLTYHQSIVSEPAKRFWGG